MPDIWSAARGDVEAEGRHRVGVAGAHLIVQVLTPERMLVQTRGDFRQRSTITLTLDGSPELTVRVERWRAAEEGTIAEFAAVDLATAKEIVRLSRYIASAPAAVLALETIEDPIRIRRALAAFINSAAECWSTNAQGALSLLALLDKHNSLLLLAERQVSLNEEILVQVTGPLSLFEFEVRVSDYNDGVIRALIPMEIRRTRRRKWLRNDLSGAHLMVRHPWFENDVVRIEARDASPGGMGLQGEVEELLLYPGLRLPEIEVWRSGRKIEGPFKGEVRHVGPSGGGASLHESAGMLTRSLSLYPRTTPEPKPVGDIWNVFVDSGYLSLAGRSSAEFRLAKAHFVHAAEQLLHQPDLSVIVGWKSPGKGLDGTISAARMYENTWTAYHLAKVSGPSTSGLPGKLVLRELHRHAYEHALAHGARYLLQYVRDDAAGWPRLLAVDFAKRHAAAGYTVAHAEHACLISCDDYALAPTPALQPIGDENEFLRQAIARHGRELADAYDYVENDWQFARLSRRWANAGLARERKILEYRASDGSVSFVVIELTSPGIHVYDLFDGVRFYGAALSNASIEAMLLPAVAEVYRRAGRKTFVLFRTSEPSTMQVPAVDMGRFTVSLVPMRVAPDYLEHLWEITSARAHF